MALSAQERVVCMCAEYYGMWNRWWGQGAACGAYVWVYYMGVELKGNLCQETVSVIFAVTPHSTQKPYNSGISPTSKSQSVLQWTSRVP